MTLKQHHIKKQLLDFEFKNKSRALEWQQKVPSHYQQDYVKVIENTLDQYDDGRCQQIDKIIVDLGTLSEAMVADQLGNALNDVLKKTLLKNVQHYEIANIDPATKTTVDLQVKSSKEELRYILRYFIAHGNFPWNVTLKSVSELEQYLQEQFTMDELAASLLAKKVLQGPWERARFFYQFEPGFVSEVFAKYFAKQYEGFNTIIEFCKKQFNKSSFSLHFKRVTDATASQRMLEWVALYAPKSEDFWPADFIPWFIERQWNSVIPFTSVSIWVSSKIVFQKSSTPHFINQHLKKIFRHLDLHLTAILKEDAFGTSKSADLKDQPTTPRIAPTENEQAHDGKTEGPQTSDEQPQLEDKNGNETLRESDEAIVKPLDESKALDVSKRQKETLKDLEQVDKDKREIPEEALEKDSQEPLIGSNPGNRDSEIGKDPVEEDETENQETGRNQQDSAKNDLLNDEKTVQRESDSKRTTPEDDLIVSKEFYKEVQETIDVAAPEDKELWDAVSETDNFTAVEPYYIHDSGLILVWPYLNRLFEKLNYIKGKEFESKELQERAITLLGYIATGNPACEEHQLVFAKFLCGWPFRMPVKKAVTLKKKELKEADAMLLGLIGNWSVLKNTSVQGLRETFFNREGKLELQEEDWKLTVEQKGTDILLDHLPYGISMIKLPWHKKMLRVDWV